MEGRLLTTGPPGTSRKSVFKINFCKLPWWLSGKEPPASAGEADSIPGLGGSPHAVEQLARVPQLLSLCSGAREPQVLKPVSTRAHASQPEKLLQEEAHTLQRRMAHPLHN